VFSLTTELPTKPNPCHPYGLHNVCAAIGYEFRHHDALEDAKAAAQVLLAAMYETGLDPAGWLKRVQQPVFGSSITQAATPLP